MEKLPRTKAKVDTYPKFNSRAFKVEVLMVGEHSVTGEEGYKKKERESRRGSDWGGAVSRASAFKG